MNRAERRRQEREAIKAKTATYNLTKDQLDAMKKEAVDEAVSKAFILMLSIPVMILHDKYWIKAASKKLPKFIDQCLDLYDSYVKDYITLDDLKDTLWKESGIKLEKRDTKNDKR